jgi:hypothetical protein
MNPLRRYYRGYYRFLIKYANIGSQDVWGLFKEVVMIDMNKLFDEYLKEKDDPNALSFEAKYKIKETAKGACSCGGVIKRQSLGGDMFSPVIACACQECHLVYAGIKSPTNLDELTEIIKADREKNVEI